MDAIRCRRCGRLLFKGMVLHIEIKCPKCGYTQIMQIQAQRSLQPPTTEVESRPAEHQA
ncbi:MAG: Com family DNA-binding transcriptional regulator [Syntrophobacteraceae bacterium]|nr:Com family DNA-binding transcriptional regulator [Syntrophobacteraceae bacterium]